MPTSQFAELQPLVVNISFVPANSPGWNTAFIQGGYAARADVVYLANSDVIDHDVSFRIVSAFWATTNIGTVTVPAGAGVTANIPPFEALTHLVGPGIGLAFDPSSHLDANCLVAPTLTNTVDLTAMGGLL